MDRRTFVHNMGCGAASVFLLPEWVYARSSKRISQDACIQFLSCIGAHPLQPGFDGANGYDIEVRVKMLEDMGYSSQKYGWYQWLDFRFCPLRLDAGVHWVDTKLLVFRCNDDVVDYCGTMSTEHMHLCLVHADALMSECRSGETLSSLCVPLKTIQSGNHGTTAFVVDAGVLYFRHEVTATGNRVSGWLNRGENTVWKAEGQTLHRWI